MKKKFLISVLAVLVVVALSSVVLAACDKTPKKPAASITVSFNLGDYEGAGNAPADVKVDKGGEVTLPNVGVTWTDHVFMGWSSDDGATVKAAGEKVVVDVDVEFVAQWADVTPVTVTFVDKDGETVLDTLTVSKGSTVSENYPYAGVAEVKWYVVREGAITTDEFVPGTGAGATIVTDAITVQKKVVVNPAFLIFGDEGNWKDEYGNNLKVSTKEGVNTFDHNGHPIEFDELDASPKGGYVFSYSYEGWDADGNDITVTHTYRAAYDSAKNVVNVYEIVDGVEGDPVEYEPVDYVDIDITYYGIWNNADGYRLSIDSNGIMYYAQGVENFSLAKGNATDGYTFVVDDTTYHCWLDGEDMKLCVAGEEADAMTLTYFDPNQGGDIGGGEEGGGSQNPEDYITVTFQDPEGNAIEGVPDDSTIRYEKMLPMDFSAAESELAKKLNQYVKWYLVVDGEVTEDEVKNGDSAPTEDITVRATIVDYTAATISADDYGTYNDANDEGKTLTISAEGITLVMPWGITYTATVENVYENPHGDGYVAVVSYSFLEPGEEEPTVLQTLYTFGKVGGGWEVYETSYGSSNADFFPEA